MTADAQPPPAIVFVLPAAPAKPVPDRARILRVISAVENWDGKTPGARKEWGPWQMLPENYARYSGRKIRDASPADLEAAAILHAGWIIQTLEARHLPVSAYTVGLAWAAGIDAARPSAIKRAYAQRCASLYDDPSFR